MTFEELNLNKPLLNALNDLGLTTPTTIQQKVFSVVMSGKDVCGIAQTGTGKTYAYLLPCLRQYQFSKDKNPQILILVPTRELVVQVVEEIKKLTTYMSTLVVGIYGGVNTKAQIAEVMQGVDILVATPGRLVDLLNVQVIKTKGIKKLVIDEFDEMLNLGFRPQLTRIFDSLPERRQNLLFSATITDEVEDLMKEFFNSPERIEATPVGTPLSNITQIGYNVPNFYTKINFLKYLLNKDAEMNKVLVFVSTKHLADVVFEHLEGDFQDKIAVIHSNKAQNHRFESVRRFEDGTCRILIATDVIARGLDVEGVSHVINIDLPEEPQSYIHRIGRTGRADRKGIALSFVTAQEKDALSAIQDLMKYKLPLQEMPAEVEKSDRILPAEEPKIDMPLFLVKPPKREDVGPAFHEKLDKNKKVNVRRDYEAEKKRKYGKSYKKRSRD
ncbi:MAG: DEAD/DEAH box helicase [Spirosomataceae bacterium]